MARTVKVSEFQRLMAAEREADRAGESDVATVDRLSGDLVAPAESEGERERRALLEKIGRRRVDAQVVDVAANGIVEAVRPAEMTPDRGEGVGETHHTITDDDISIETKSNKAGVVSDLIPSQASFGTAPYLDAPELEEMAERLIVTKDQLVNLVDLKIVYRWRAKGGTSKGWPKLADIERVSGQTLAFIAGPAPHLLVWLAADTLRESAVTERQLEAILFDQLVSVEWSDGDEDGDPTWRLVGPEVVCHLATLEEYGAFTRKLEAAKSAFIQPSLFEASIAVDPGLTQEEAERVISAAAAAYQQMRAEGADEDDGPGDGLDAV